MLSAVVYIGKIISYDSYYVGITQLCGIGKRQVAMVTEEG